MEFQEVFDKAIDNKDLNNFWLQPGFVEGIINENKSFKSLEKAYRHIFRRNKEYAIALINAIPVRWSYIEDIPVMIDSIVELLKNIVKTNEASEFKIDFKTPNLSSQWIVKSDSEWIEIDMKWIRVSGNYEAALNLLSNVKMPKLKFLYEWKLLLEQLIKAFDDAGAVLIKPDDHKLLKEMNNLNNSIKNRGLFYR